MLLHGAAGADPATVAKSAREWRVEHEHEIVAEFAELLSISNLANDAPNIERNAETIRAMCEKPGLTSKLLTIEAAPQVVVADLACRMGNERLHSTPLRWAAGFGAQASNTIPTEARASIDLRPVPNETPESIKLLVERHIAAQPAG